MMELYTQKKASIFFGFIPSENEEEYGPSYT